MARGRPVAAACSQPGYARGTGVAGPVAQPARGPGAPCRDRAPVRRGPGQQDGGRKGPRQLPDGRQVARTLPHPGPHGPLRRTPAGPAAHHPGRHPHDAAAEDPRDPPPPPTAARTGPAVPWPRPPGSQSPRSSASGPRSTSSPTGRSTPALHRPLLRREGPRHRRPLPQPARPRHGPVR